MKYPAAAEAFDRLLCMMDDLREKLKVVLKRIEMGKVLIPSYQKKQCHFD